MKYDLLDIKDPSFLKDLSIKELTELAEDIRSFLIEKIARTGGHLSPNLGTVELIIALHTVFDSPQDRLVFDVGHQAYTHKILTGRAKEFETLRQYKGLSGFLKKSESIHDVFEAGHSSTSLAAVSGMSIANDSEGRVVGLIGDGALTSGMAFEALNFLGGRNDIKPIIILNDNEMSISRNIGFFAKLLNNLKTKRFIQVIRSISHKIFPKFVVKVIQRLELGIKKILVKNTFFEDLGFKHFGPLNGHNLEELIRYFRIAKDIKKPIAIHVITEKGRGYPLAENDTQGIWHGVGPFDIETGKPLKNLEKNSVSYSTIVSETLEENLASGKDIKIVIPAMIVGSKLSNILSKYPDHIIDVGIAEQLAVTMAAGIATEGKHVFVPIYSTFLQRAYDQVNHDVCRQNLHVVFGIDRAGLVGADGETHQGIFDIPFLRHIPNMTIIHPLGMRELKASIHYAFYQHNGPIAIRYERGVTEIEQDAGVSFDLKWTILNKGESKIAFVAFGSILHQVLSELSSLDVTVVNARSIKPLDKDVLNMLNDHTIITYEESVLSGGFGSSILEFYHDQKSIPTIHCMGFKDAYIKEGTKEELLNENKLSKDDVIKVIKSYM
jgi:1-deoxy-D-xylulose-5-phosphate synthase